MKQRKFLPTFDQTLRPTHMMLTVNGNGWEQLRDYHMHGAQSTVSIKRDRCHCLWANINNGTRKNQPNKTQMSTYVYIYHSFSSLVVQRLRLGRHSQTVVAVQRPAITGRDICVG